MSWNPGPLKHWLAINDSGVWGDDPLGTDDSVVLRSTDIRLEGGWAISDPAVRHLSAPERLAKQLRVGDLVVVKSSGSPAHLGKTAIVTEHVAAMRPCFANFVQRLRPRPSADSRYVWYLLNSKHIADEMAILGNTTTGLRNLNGTIIGSLAFPGPPLKEQRVIADFLDRETARIDALIAAKRRMIELLDQRFRAACGALTAMDPNGDRWPMVPLRWSMRRIVDGTHGTYERVTTGKPLLSAKNLVGGRVRVGDDESLISEIDYTSIVASRRFTPGDVLLGVIGGSIGNVARLGDSDPLAFQRSVAALSPGGHYSPDFLYFVCLSGRFQSALTLASNESAQAGVYLDSLAAIAVPYPPIEDQHEVARRLLTAQADKESIVRCLVRQTNLLVEHRQAMITAAVTGDLAVGVAA